MVEPQPSKLMMPVRSRSAALNESPAGRVIWCAALRSLKDFIARISRVPLRTGLDSAASASPEWAGAIPASRLLWRAVPERGGWAGVTSALPVGLRPDMRHHCRAFASGCWSQRSDRLRELRQYSPQASAPPLRAQIATILKGADPVTRFTPGATIKTLDHVKRLGLRVRAARSVGLSFLAAQRYPAVAFAPNDRRLCLQGKRRVLVGKQQNVCLHTQKPAHDVYDQVSRRFGPAAGK